MSYIDIILIGFLNLGNCIPENCDKNISKIKSIVTNQICGIQYDFASNYDEFKLLLRNIAQSLFNYREGK